MAKKTIQPYVLLFILFFITYGYFFQGGGWNQNSRICLVRAIIHYRTFSIDNYKEDADEPYYEFVNTGDWAYRNDHYYSDKAPGISFMGVIPFAATEYNLKKFFEKTPENLVFFSTYISTLFTSVLSSTLLCLLLFHVFSQFFNLNSFRSMLLTLFFGFGTLVFSYSTTFYSHVPCAFFSFFSFVLAMYIKNYNFKNKKKLAFLAGFFAAVAVVTEYPAIFSLICILIYLTSFQEGRKYAVSFFTGCILPGVILCLYLFVCFGSPFVTGYHYSNPVIQWSINGNLFGIPTPSKIIQLLFYPYRGLFFSSPVLLMALPGIFLQIKKRKRISETMLCLCLTSIIVMFVASFYAWHGGTAVGPRYLIIAFPFGFLLTVYAYKKFPIIFTVLGLLSILINLSITIVGNEIPREIKNPLHDVVCKSILDGEVSINPIPITNFKNYPHIYKLADMKNWTPNFNSFNLGELLFPHQITSILPLILFWIIWGYTWWKKVGNPTPNNQGPLLP